MKKFLILIVLCTFFLSPLIYAADEVKNAKDELQKRSQLNENSPFYRNTSYPEPFTKTNNPTWIINAKNQPPISTGYYFVDTDDPAPAKWRAVPLLTDTSFEEKNWRRIIQGPYLWNISEAKNNPSEGMRYFRNPSVASDSTNNAIAGPIPIGFPFYFNGLRFDSFYVSTNGMIALSNRRYKYDAFGARKQPEGGETDCYDFMSMDWFFRSGRSGNGINDPLADNYGWTVSVPPLIGSNGYGGLETMQAGAVLIAPFFGDLHLSQWNKDTRLAEDFGKVYFYRNTAGSKLIIYFVQIALGGGGSVVGTPSGVTYVPDVNLRSHEQGYGGANAQVILDRNDSSVTFLYEKFEGRFDYGLGMYEANKLFRFNTTAGVRGYARHVNYDSKNLASGTFPWAGEYQQFTHYYSKYLTDAVQFPRAYIAVKFKQWKNTLRVVDIQYRVRKKEAGASAYTEKVTSTQAWDYELLAGHDQIGQIQPVAIVQNLTNDIQGPTGVNFQPQDLNFRVRMAIVNEASQKPVYNKYVPVDSLSLAIKRGDDPYTKIILSNAKLTGSDYDTDTSMLYDANNKLDPYIKGVPPYGFVQIYFPPFEPNDLFQSQIGRMRAYLMADPTDPRNGEGLKDTWPFDDTTWVRFFVMQRIKNEQTFKDDITEFHIIYGAPMPSTLKWVNINGDVVPGEEVSYHPLPPRGDFVCANSDVYPNTAISSPCVKLDRRPEPGPPGTWGGDEMRSYPVDLSGKFGAVLSLSAQRTSKRADWPRGWSDGDNAGVEHRVVTSNWYSLCRDGDRLRVEFARPSVDGIDRITNIPAANWQYHLRRKGAAAVTNVSAFELFGGGGYRVGFLETDKDSALSMESLSTPYPLNALRYDFFDDGIDFQFKNIQVALPDTIINAPYTGGGDETYAGARTFRFRIRVYARDDNLNNPLRVPDDFDEFFVDNIRILQSYAEDVDVEISTVKLLWPYTLAPASQMIAIPIVLTVSNNTSNNAPALWLKVRIIAVEDLPRVTDSTPYTVYCRVKQLPFLRPGSNVDVPMPEWNARTAPRGQYRIFGSVYVPGGDLEERNDTTYFDFDLQYGPVFAYDPITDVENLNRANNDVPAFAGTAGRGINIRGYSNGGTGSAFDEINWGCGDQGGDGGSGQIASKFQLYQADTIYGYQVYLGTLNASHEIVRYALYKGDTEPNEIIDSSIVETKRGWDDVRKARFFDQYTTIFLPKPVILPAGTYWVAVAQLGEQGLELGASASRAGIRVTNEYLYVPNPNDVRRNGSASYHLLIDKGLRTKERYGNLVNINLFAYENTINSGAWVQFMPTTDNMAYGHLNYRGLLPDGTLTWSRGTFIPMIRAYLGNRWAAQSRVYVDCKDIPVQMMNFNGEVSGPCIRLNWQTASEKNNQGFYVEKRLSGQTDWKSIGFVKGLEFSNSVKNYSYKDFEVKTKTTYEYRLRQIDVDGKQSCDSYSDIVEVTYNTVGSLTLEPNMPNPFENVTTIKFYLPTTSMVKLEVLDIFGNVVKTLANEELGAQEHKYYWNGTDENGNQNASGTYIYRLTAGKEVLTGKMTLLR